MGGHPDLSTHLLLLAHHLPLHRGLLLNYSYACPLCLPQLHCKLSLLAAQARLMYILLSNHIFLVLVEHGHFYVSDVLAYGVNEPVHQGFRLENVQDVTFIRSMLPKDEYEVIGLQELLLTEVAACMSHGPMNGVLETHKSVGCAI